MAAPSGTIDIWNFVKKDGTTVRKWLRDSWARRQIVALQQAIMTKADSAKFAVITGVCSASSGNSAVTAYPTGFSSSNCVILSLMVSYNAMWRYVGDGVLTQSGRLYALMESTGVSVYNSSSYGYGQNWKAVLMRTDI